MSANLKVQSTMSSDDTCSKPKQRVCKICQKTFTKQFNLNVHMMIHADKRPFKCEDCDLTFRQKSHCKKHWERTHMNPAPVSCDLCLKSDEDSLFDYHSAQNSGCGHKNARRKNCDACGKFVFTMKHHHHCNGKSFTEERHLCDVCGKSFTRKLTLIQHQRIHTKEKPYLCQVCGKTFAYSSALNTHGQVHRDEKRFFCDREGCGKVYRRRNDLLRHVKRKHSYSF